MGHRDRRAGRGLFRGRCAPVRRRNSLLALAVALPGSAYAAPRGQSGEVGRGCGRSCCATGI